MKFLLALLITTIFACNSKKVYSEVVQTDKIDPDIILFNISNGDRTDIANLLLDIEKCNPLAVGVDVIFPENKLSVEDSILANAFEKIHSDILAYKFDSTEKEIRSIDKFRKLGLAEGYTNLYQIDGVTSHFTPIKELNGKLAESFALKIIKQWKPGFKYNFSIDESIPILFQRSLQQYYYFVSEDLLDKNVCDLLKNKVILVGFLGPGDETKQYTPIRRNDKNIERKPDTYGLVVQANAIRTILEYEK